LRCPRTCACPEGRLAPRGREHCNDFRSEHRSPPLAAIRPQRRGCARRLPQEVSVARWRGDTRHWRKLHTRAAEVPRGARRRLADTAVEGGTECSSVDELRCPGRYVVADARACTLTQRAPVKSRLPAHEGRRTAEPISLHQRRARCSRPPAGGRRFRGLGPFSEERAHLRSRRLDPGPRRPGRSGVDTNASTSAALMLWEHSSDTHLATGGTSPTAATALKVPAVTWLHGILADTAAAHDDDGPKAAPVQSSVEDCRDFHCLP
jgi:hypothetical protein